MIALSLDCADISLLGMECESECLLVRYEIALRLESIKIFHLKMCVYVCVCVCVCVQMSRVQEELEEERRLHNSQMNELKFEIDRLRQV